MCGAAAVQPDSPHVPSFVRSELGNRSAQNPFSERRGLVGAVLAGLVSVSTCGVVSSLSLRPPALVPEPRRNREGSAIDAMRRESLDEPAPAPTAGWLGDPDSASVKASSSSGSMPTR